MNTSLDAQTNGACCPPDAKSTEKLSQASQLAASAEVDVVARLKALADPTRLRMLGLLADHQEPLCVCEITPQFALHQPTISHHLRLLREAGLADCERRGTWAYYWATEAGRRALALVADLR